MLGAKIYDNTVISVVQYKFGTLAIKVIGEKSC